MAEVIKSYYLLFVEMNVILFIYLNNICEGGISMKKKALLLSIVMMLALIMPVQAAGIEPKGGGGSLCYQSVKNIKQTQTFNCGPTTVLQTLYGLNSASAVSGSTDAAKIAALQSEYNVGSDGMYVSNVVAALNKYNKGNQTYSSRLGSGLSLEGFANNIAASLTSGKPVVLHARTKHLDYYNGNNSGHYLSLDYFDRSTNTVRIVDCNYKEEYYGVHYCTLQEAYEAINEEGGRYLIY